MIDCVITGISQEMDFEQGASMTYLTVRLPNGRLVRAAIDDETAAEVVGLQVKNKGMPRPVMRAPAPLEQRQPEPEAGAVDDYSEPPGGGFTPAPAEEDPPGDTMHVFGGQDSPDAPRGPVPATREEVNVANAEAAMTGTEPEDEGSPTIVVEGPPATPPGRVRSVVQRLPNGKIIVPSRTVPKTDRGYPIVANAGADPQAIVGGRDQDEDGVGSV